MENNNLITIDLTEYQWMGKKLETEIENAKEKFKNNKKGKGGFWKDVKKESGLSRSTIEGWYEKHVPRVADDIFILANYLGCSAYLFLEPIAYATKQLEKTDIPEKIDIIKKKRKELHIDVVFLHIYLVVICGHEISLALIWQILCGKKMPSANLCNDILNLFALVEHNSKCDFLDPVNVCLSHDEMLAYRKACHIYRTQAKQLGLNMTFISRYLQKVKGYKINPLSIRAIMYGIYFPTDSFKAALEELFDQTAQYTMCMLFPLTSDQTHYATSRKQIKSSYVCKKAISVVFESNIYERRKQIKRIESYAENRHIKLNEMKVHFFRESNYDELREAMNLVEAGYYDAILLYARGTCVHKDIEDKFSQYAVCHNIPIIYMEDQYYI